MENLRTFEEYRHFKFKRFRNDRVINGNYINNIKDKKEPFFNWKKKEYFDEVRNRTREENTMRSIEHFDNREKMIKEKYFEQKPLIEKYLDILKNHKEQIFRYAYKKHEKDESIEQFGLMLKDQSVLAACVKYNKYFLDDNNYFNSLKINNEKIYQWREKKINELDPYREDVWEDDTKNEVDELWLLIIEIVKGSQEYFEKSFA